MTRDEVIQSFLSRFERPRYLEIGVEDGVTFHALTALHKTAVDPRFRFDVGEARRRNENCTYEACTSDEFFGVRVRPDERYQVIYLDGLHTFEQTLRDLLNAVFHLSEDGVVIVDDVVPPTFSAAVRDELDVQFLRSRLANERLDISWMGDVYKLVHFVGEFMQQFQYATTSDNHGQMILWRDRRRAVEHRHELMSTIADLDFLGMVRQLDALRLRATLEIVEDFEGRTRPRG